MATRTVVHILNGEIFAGVDRTQLNLCRFVDPLRYHLHIITLLDGFTADRAQEMGYTVDVLRMKSRLDLNVVRTIREILQDTNASLMQAHTIRGHLVGALAAHKLHVPVLAHIHSPAIHESERTIKNLWNAFLEARLQRRTDCYMVVADSLKAHLIQKGIPLNKIITLLNAVDVMGLIETSQGMEPSVYQRLGLDDETKLIGMAATFRHRKGAQDLLQAVKILGEQVIPYRLVMIGGGEKLAGGGNYLDVLKQMTVQLGIDHQVIFVGYQEKPQQWMAALDMLVLPSRFGEGLPLVVLEAMALGIPVIATPVEGTAEVLIDQVTGLLPPAEDPEALAKSIKTLLFDPKKGRTMARKAKEVVLQRFDAREYAQRLMEIYDEVLKN